MGVRGVEILGILGPVAATGYIVRTVLGIIIRWR
jgi:hypothetical protein